MANQFSQPSGSVATSTTAKTVVAVKSDTTAGCALIGVTFSSDATVTSGQYLVELVRYDGTTAGTSTAGTPVAYGATQAGVKATTAYNYTAEPTVGTVMDAWWLPAQSQQAVLWPLGRELFVAGGKTLGVRVTAPSGTPNVRATLVFEE